MDKNHEDILKQVKDYLYAPLTDDEIKANDGRYYPGQTWYLKNINDLTKDKETILAIAALLEKEHEESAKIYVKKYGWGGDAPWSGNINNSMFMSLPKNTLGVRNQKIYDCKEQLVLPGLISSIKGLFRTGTKGNEALVWLIAIGMILIPILFVIGIYTTDWDSDSGGFCNYVNGEKQCYTDREIQQMIP